MNTNTRSSLKRIAAAANAAETEDVERKKKKVQKSCVTRAATLAPPATKLPPIQGTSSDDDSSYDSNSSPSEDVLDGLRLADIPLSVLDAEKKPAHVPPLPTKSVTASVPPPMATNYVSANVPPPMDFVGKFLPPKSIFLSGMLNSYGNIAEVNVNHFSQISCCAYDSIVVRLYLCVFTFVCYKSCCLGLNTNCDWFILN